MTAGADEQWKTRQLYTGARGSAWSLLLFSARVGTLEPNWRDNLAVDLDSWFERTGAAGFVGGRLDLVEDAKQAVLQELAELPVQLWEPYVVAGDWRAALDAWYRASTELCDWRWLVVEEQDQKSMWGSDDLPQSFIDRRLARHRAHLARLAKEYLAIGDLPTYWCATWN